MRIAVQLYEDLAELSEAVLRQWMNLPRPSPMQSPEWLCAWWQTYAADGRDRLHLVMAFDDETLIGVAPFYIQRPWIGTHRMRMLGDGAVCSDHATVLTLPGYEAVVRAAVAEHFQSGAGRGWHTILWQSIDATDQNLRELAEGLAPPPSRRQVRERAGCWQVTLPATWTEYLGGLSKNQRKRIRRWEREYFDSGRAVVTTTAAADAHVAWQQLADLNRKRREQAGDRSVFLDDRFHEFHLRILRPMIEHGQAELRQLVLDGRPVAAEYVLLQRPTIFCYQSGMELGEHRDGYGNLSIMALFRDAIERGFSQIDFLRGDEAYKQHWGAQRTACVDHYVAAATLPGCAHNALQQTIATARDLRSWMSPCWS